MIIKLLVEGGDMKPNPTISQKLGPLGINIGKVIQDVNKTTSNFKGMKVPIELDINVKTKNFSVNVFSPPTSELIKKEIGIEKGSGDGKKLKVGNLAIEQVIKVAKIKSPSMTASNFKAAVRSVVGSCTSLGILIENKEAKEVEKEISQGVYDKEINEEIAEASEEKKKQISDFFTKVKAKQDELLKKEEEAKKAEEAEKAAKAPAGAQVTEAPGASATATPSAPGKPAAKEEKPAAKKK